MSISNLNNGSNDSGDNLKEKLERLTSSNVYCWVVLIAAVVAIIMAFILHEGTKYSDKFFLVLAILVIGILINVNQLRKNYLNKKDKP